MHQPARQGAAMTRAEVLAGLAGVVAAGAIVELASVRRAGRRGRRWEGMATGARAVARRVGAGRRSAGGLAGRVDAAGSSAGVGEVMLAKLAAAPAAALAVVGLVPVAPGRLGIALLVAAPLAGFFAPDLWLRRRARARARAIEAEQADVLDLLRVAVGAGLAPWRALAEVGRRHPGLLAGELGAAARRVALGVPADAALARLERRCPAAGTHALTAALRRADRLGAPPARALGALAEEARARQARRAGEQAARAAPKIQLVVALLLVPSVLLMVAAALVPALTGASL
jgi:tight adherence protein C